MGVTTLDTDPITPRPDSGSGSTGSTDGGPLRIAFLCYRGNPRCGGQGVYTRYLTRELVAMGHQVEVFAGPPYPDLEAGVAFTPVPNLDLYRDPDPFRVPRPNEFHSLIDLAEFGLMCTAGFPEPLTFSWRVRRILRARRTEFDIVHDNQCLGRGIGKLVDEGWPVVATVHHPITVDRVLDLAHATTLRRRMSIRRWYGFLGMQMEVARRMPSVLTVSHSSLRDISAQMGVDPDRMAVVPVGVDHDIFRPLPGVSRVPGRIMTTASADVPMKGLVPLLEAVAKARTERHVELVIIGRLRPESKIPRLIDSLGIGGAVRFVSGISDDEVVKLYAEAEVAVVPSLYEGFSLPAVEAMSCGVPLVATTGGAIPEVVGEDGVTGLLVPPGDPAALASGIVQALDDAGLRARLGAAGRDRVMSKFTWRASAEGSIAAYRRLLGTGVARDAAKVAR